ncbi:MAG: Hsp20/alpha crystallin family protein [Armatimonadetes bacterium]|nr:Hsp20/alpha crystallin family protein [Armatimonadota bacterium]
MVIARWDPFRDLEELQERVNRLFQDRMGRGEPRERAWAPVVDAYEDENNIVLRAELPGMKREDINIEVTQDSLTISGERKFEEDKKNYVRVERPYGPFARTFAINTPVNTANVKATYKDGILELIIPKAEETRPRKIQVSVE